MVKACHEASSDSGSREKATPGVRSSKSDCKGAWTQASLTRGCCYNQLPQLLMFTDHPTTQRHLSVICIEHWWESSSGLYANVYPVFSLNLFECAYGLCIHDVLKHVLSGKFVFPILYLGGCNSEISILRHYGRLSEVFQLGCANKGKD